MISLAIVQGNVVEMDEQVNEIYTSSFQHCSKTASASWLWILRASAIIANKPWPRLSLTMATTTLILVMAIFNMVRQASCRFTFCYSYMTPIIQQITQYLLYIFLFICKFLFCDKKNCGLTSRQIRAPGLKPSMQFHFLCIRLEQRC